MPVGPPACQRPLIDGIRRFLGNVGAGFLTLAPILVTLVILDWLLRATIEFIGPQSFIGQAFTAIGSFIAGGRPLLGYFIGVALLIAAISLLGAFVQRQARDAFANGLDNLLGSVPLFGRIYRPMAQLVRSMTGDTHAEMSAMRAVVIHFGGGVESVGFLTSSNIFDVGQGPSMMVLVPTAPVPFGGALMLVPVEKLRTIPGMDFEETAKLFLTMGTVAPPQMLTPGGTAPAAPPAAPASAPAAPPKAG